MRVSLRALAIFGALAIASALSSAVAQNESAAQTGDAAKSDVIANTGGAAVQDRDVKAALAEIISAWHDYGPCNRAKSCSLYFESYGVALTFNDGTIVPFAHTQRLAASAHDCIVNARTALASGDRGLAVQWVMASYLHDILFRNWLADHPDAVIAALHRCCY
jgi:hypothetical protein